MSIKIAKLALLTLKRKTNKMAKVLLLITVLVCCYKAQAANVLVQEFGPGMAVFYEYKTGSTGTFLNFVSSSNILLHVVYRPLTSKVGMDSFNGNEWQNIIFPHNFHISPTVTKITNVVEVKNNGFDIYINGKHSFFSHRYDVRAVRRISTVRQIQLSVGKVLKDYSIGRVIYIKATAPSTGDFRIDLIPNLPNSMTCKWEKISLVLHAKFNAIPQAVSRNTYGPTCGRLELGENGGDMPFIAGQQFEVVIVAQQFAFEIGVNGTHFATYEYRMPLSKDMTVMLTNVPSIEKIQYY